MVPLVDALMRKELDGLRDVEDAFAAGLLPDGDLAAAVRGAVENGDVEEFVHDSSDMDEFHHLINDG